MGMRTDAHTGPLKLPGHGRHMGPMGNAHGKANWTANVQAGMCTRVAHGVSVSLFLSNCANRQTGRVGMGNSSEVTDGVGRVGMGKKKIVGRHGPERARPMPIL